MLTVSVVVPVFNAARTLPRCLAALERLRPAPVEVLLVDNGSTDGSAAMLDAYAEGREAAVRVLREATRGPGAARNAGIRAALGDIIAFTDADCVPEPDWLAHALEPFHDPRVGAVAGRVLGRGAGVTERFSTLYTFQLPPYTMRHETWSPRCGGYPTANLAVRRELLRRLNGFDESIPIYGEDYDLCVRLYRLGMAIVYTPHARVGHLHRTSVRAVLSQAFEFGRSHAFLLQRHVRRGVWVELPRYAWSSTALPLRAWIDLGSLDKKLIALMVLAWFHPPAWWLLPPYAVWLLVDVVRRAHRHAVAVTPWSCLGMVGLLLLKSGALTAGRWAGSVRYRTVCL